MDGRKNRSTAKMQKVEDSLAYIIKLQDAVYPKSLKAFEGMKLLTIPSVLNIAQNMQSIFYPVQAASLINILPENMPSFFEKISQFQKSFRDVFPKIPESLSRIGKIAFSIKERLDHINEEQKNTVEKCMEYGWYPIASMSLTYISGEENFEQVMEKYIDEKTIEIEDNVCESNPHRADIIKEAFEAHRNEKYSLAIPVILAQADGICNEQVGISPFSKKHGEQLQDKIPSELYNNFLCHYFKPVIFATQIRANTADIPPSTLNRHHVLHGISTEYATRQNSLKAISYIGSLDGLLRELVEEQKEKKKV